MFKKKIKLSRAQKKVIAERKAIEEAKRNKSEKYNEFVRLGGANSGLYDISDKSVAEFVKEFCVFIPKSEICTRDKNGNLIRINKT